MGVPNLLNRSYIWFLKTTTLFEDQADSILAWADDTTTRIDFTRGQELSFQQGGRLNIYLIVEGQVKLRALTESGKEKILDIAGPGDAVGPLDRLVVHKHQPEEGLPTEAVAMSKGHALCLEVDHFRQLVERRPMVILNVSRMLGLKQRQFEIRLSRLLYRSSLGKVAGLLAEMAERYGDKKDGAVELQFRLTHQEMASLIGSKRETVTECLSILELDELISTKGGKMVILKLAELEKIL